MERLLISCDSCKRMWLMPLGFSIYAQQALESRPCPHCGAYTLSCEAAEPKGDHGIRVAHPGLEVD